MKPLVKKAKKSRQNEDIPDLVPTGTGNFDQGRNLREIDKLDDEIAALEAKLGVANDSKAKRKLKKQAEMEGMGVGFMDFLEEINSVVKGKKSDWKKRDHDFNDDSKEVLLDFEKFAGPASGVRPADDNDDSDQSGFEHEQDEESGMEELEASMSENE